ncbi:MAG: hypothetical protein EHM20_00245 [Alphaproteobacteria bacterium]|nr:MAG: hypothetical protein EHM20_00245 [Alphaproteobacteria bacterium]
MNNKISITKFEIISFCVIGIALEYFGQNPLFSLFFILFSQMLKLAMEKQKKRVKLFSMMRLTHEYFFKLDFRGVIGFLIALFVLVGLLIIKRNFPLKSLFLPLILAYPLDLIRFIIWNFKKTTKIVNNLEKSFKNDVNLIENVRGVLTLKSNIPLTETHKNQLNIITNSTVTKIKNDIFNRNIYYVKYKKGFDDRYSKMEIGSRDRLEQILKDMKGLPNFVSATTDKYQDIYIYQSKIKLKFLNRELNEVTHKLGIKPGSLEVTTNGGNYEFKIKKLENKIYYLDEVIETVRPPKDMILPFIVGINPTNGKVVFSDMTKLTHAIVGGMTNTGKSCTANTWIDGMEYYSYDKLVIFITDFKRSAMNKYRGIKNIHMLEDSESAQMEFYINLIAEFKRRLKIFEDVTFDTGIECRDIGQYNKMFPDNPLPYFLIVSDEINTPVQMNYKKEYTIDFGTETQEMNYKDIRTYFLTKSRSVGFHILDIIQKATDDQYYKSWRVSIDGRAIHKFAESSEIKYMLESPDYYDYAMHQEQGYFCFKDEKGIIYKLKGVYIDDKHNRVFEAIKEIGYAKPTRGKADLNKSPLPDKAATQ